MDFFVFPGGIVRNRCRQFNVDRTAVEQLVYILRGSQAARTERIHKGMDLLGIGQASRGIDDLLADLRGQLGKLLPRHLALIGAEGVDHPLVQFIF